MSIQSIGPVPKSTRYESFCVQQISNAWSTDHRNLYHDHRNLYHNCDRARFNLARLQDVFKSVERLCEAEGIDCAKFMYRDNTTILETLEGNR